MLTVLDPPAARRWAMTALAGLADAREEIDALNVFPVPDGDTGTNLYLTLESAVTSVLTLPGHAPVTDVARTFARGALLGARGNSGVIAAEMLRGWAQTLAEHDTLTAQITAECFRRADEQAWRAVHEPVEGTILSVSRAAARAALDAAASDFGGELEVVVSAAAEAAQLALARTPVQLPALAAAGVVDAGGRGLVVLLDALCEVVLADRTHHRRRRRRPANLPTPDVTGCSRPGPLPAVPSPAADPGRPNRICDRPDRSVVEAGVWPTTVGASAVGPATGLPASRRPGDPRPLDPWTPEPRGHTLMGRDLPVRDLPRDCAARDLPPRDLRGREARAAHESRVGCRVQEPGAGRPDEHLAADEHRPRTARHDHPGPGQPVGPELYEVMFLLDTDPQLGEAAVTRLREQLGRCGASLVVVGGPDLWQVHVHVEDAGAAVESALEVGHPHQIRISCLGAASPVPRPAPRTRSTGLVACAAGPGLAELFAGTGAVVVAGGPGRRPSTAEILAAVGRTGADEVVVLPNDGDTLSVARVAAASARAEGVRVTVLPTRAQIQGLAAAAVHDPDRRFDDDVVAMSSAAGAARDAAVTVAVRDGYTSAGECHVGDALGVVDGDFAVIGSDLSAVAVEVLNRLLAAGGELVTLVVGVGGHEALARRVATHARGLGLGLEVNVVNGGQPRYPLLIGVE